MQVPKSNEAFWSLAGQKTGSLLCVPGISKAILRLLHLSGWRSCHVLNFLRLAAGDCGGSHQIWALHIRLLRRFVRKDDMIDPKLEIRLQASQVQDL
jgi:hypothetical protein